MKVDKLTTANFQRAKKTSLTDWMGEEHCPWTTPGSVSQTEWKLNHTFQLHRTATRHSCDH